MAAVDPSPASVEACAAAVPGAEVRLGHAERPPLADRRFGAVLSRLVIDKVDRPAALAEMRRVARRGAAVAACVWDFERGMTLLRALWREAGLHAVEVGALEVAADHLDLDDAWRSFPVVTGRSGTSCRSLDEPRARR